MLDKTFKVSLVLKGLDGVLELVGGVILLFLTPQAIASIAKTVTQHELASDPHDYIANHILHASAATNASTTIFGALYLISHGIVKIVLVTAVLKNKLWAYPWMVAFLVIFIGYQIYRMSYKFSYGMLLLTIFDIFIVVLTVIEYRRHKSAHEQMATE